MAVSCAVLIIVILIGSLMTIFSYIVKRNLIVTGYGEQVRRLAQTVSSAIDPDRFAQTAEAGAPAGEYWQDVKDLLDRILNETGVMFIYTVLYGPEDEITYFATGDIYGNDEWVVEFLSLDTDIEWYPQELFEAMYTGEVTNSGIYDADEFGILIGGFAPIINSDGRVVGVASVEINVDDVVDTINTSILTMSVFAVIIIVVFFALAMVVANKGLIRPVNEITGSMSKISDGDFSFTPPKSSIREINILSESFGNMIRRLSTVIEKIQKRNQDIIEGNLTKSDDGFTAKGDYQKILDGADAIAESMSKHVDELAKQLHIVNESIRYASKIQMNLIPDDNKLKEAFSDYSVIWKPRDVVGGDIYWAKNFDDGTVMCVCDCTGHGTPGALLTMLVVSAFESTVVNDKHNDPAEIIYMLDKKISSALNVRNDNEFSADINDGCDLAVLFVSKDGNITLAAGNMSVFASDGKEVTRYKGQKMYVGEGKIESKDSIETMHIPYNPNNKFYIASDGLYDQIGGTEQVPYGYEEFEKIILEKHNADQKSISDEIWQSFETYRDNNARRDDFELITFKPKNEKEDDKNV
ncbi:MAG: SpoIIE family protein phosphatase [Oscillospiraceae bacterium]|nr:SpoIIE family protein phosphatase [Oscillospiraceae bacterium]